MKQSEAGRELEIMRELDNCTESLGQLKCASSQLLDRIGKVCSPAPPRNKDVGVSHETGSEIGSKIRGITDEVMLVKTNIENALDCLEL